MRPSSLSTARCVLQSFTHPVVLVRIGYGAGQPVIPIGGCHNYLIEVIINVGLLLNYYTAKKPIRLV